MRIDTIYDNYEELIDHGNKRLRSIALSIAEAGIKAVIPYDRTWDYISYDGKDRVVVDGRVFDLDPSSRIYVVGVGKGSFPIAQAIDEILGDRIVYMIVQTVILCVGKKKNWVLIVLYSIVFTVVAWFFFVKVLHVMLPT